MDNLVVPVIKELDLKLQVPFLLYRNHAGDIYGIWFYDQVRFCLYLGRALIVLIFLLGRM